jgi:hypothetical protein
MNIEGIQLQEELAQKCTNISFLAIVSLAIILDIVHYILEPMENTIIKMFKDMVIRTIIIIIIKRIETIIHSLHYKITMLTNAIIMVTKLVIVDYCYTLFSSSL